MKATESDDKFNFERELKIIRLMLGMVVAGLLLSGLTTFWLPQEIKWLIETVWSNSPDTFPFFSGEYELLVKVGRGLEIIDRDYPQILLGTDWLGFAHIILAILFLGALKDPARNIWVIQFGMISAVLVVPAAFLFGYVRELPSIHYFVDAAFGVTAFVPLYIAYSMAGKISRAETYRET